MIEPDHSCIMFDLNWNGIEMGNSKFAKFSFEKITRKFIIGQL